ncbi:MAG: hypothetical protein SPI65_03015 [Peptoniphilus sp.]|nr:hypothetical protein [Peptoniphilus sp.]MDD7363144.1 hypothetical protein [Bacillota bacterium]MDY6044532.1 hypothetical protein [Peptoniphilus sp.]
MDEQLTDTEKQKETDRRWVEKNRKHKQYLLQRSTARSFIRNRATSEDVKELKEMIDEKEKV